MFDAHRKAILHGIRRVLYGMRNNMCSLNQPNLSITHTACLLICFHNPLLEAWITQICFALVCEFFSLFVISTVKLTTSSQSGFAKP